MKYNTNTSLLAARLFRRGHRRSAGFLFLSRWGSGSSAVSKTADEGSIPSLDVPSLTTHILSTASTVTHGRTKVSAEIPCKIPQRSVQDGVNLDCEVGVVNR